SGLPPTRELHTPPTFTLHSAHHACRYGRINEIRTPTPTTRLGNKTPPHVHLALRQNHAVVVAGHEKKGTRGETPPIIAAFAKSRPWSRTTVGDARYHTPCVWVCFVLYHGDSHPHFPW
ncbi:unnamed protein product, partial [Ectocarpus fasciculatus]